MSSDLSFSILKIFYFYDFCVRIKSLLKNGFWDLHILQLFIETSFLIQKSFKCTSLNFFNFKLFLMNFKNKIPKYKTFDRSLCQKCEQHLHPNMRHLWKRSFQNSSRRFVHHEDLNCKDRLIEIQCHEGWIDYRFESKLIIIYLLDQGFESWK